MTEFYIGQNVFATIEGQIVRLRNKFGVTVTFDVGGIGILWGEYQARREHVPQRESSRTSPFQP